MLYYTPPHGMEIYLKDRVLRLEFETAVGKLARDAQDPAVLKVDKERHESLLRENPEYQALFTLYTADAGRLDRQWKKAGPLALFFPSYLKTWSQSRREQKRMVEIAFGPSL